MLSVNQEDDLMQTLVESSLLSSIEYLSDQTLELTFRSGVTYRYFAVPQTVVEEFVAAESKGTYFNRHVRNRFPYQRL
jgi:KTSC domain-containing protein